ncbi:MAG: glycosyltransferase family 1 protein, partial [Satyrvirus sp.]
QTDESQLSPHSNIIYDASPETVSKYMNMSKCGIMLSASEGGCYSSTEYLYCGLPIVSTRSKGGRDAYYDDYNCLICDDDCTDVERKVSEIISKTIDPQKIRNDAISKSNIMLSTLKNNIIKQILEKENDTCNIDEFFDMLMNKRNINASKGRTIFQPEISTHPSLQDILSIINMAPLLVQPSMY